MKVYLIGSITHGDCMKFIDEFVFDTMEVPDPDFSSSHRNCYDGVTFDYKYFKTEKEAVKEFLEFVDGAKQLYDPELIPDDTNEIYWKIVKIAKKKYPEILI